MTDTDRKLLENLIAHAAETRVFLGNKMKPERERAVCRAFLRAVGVSFDENELLREFGVSKNNEKNNVCFGTSRLLPNCNLTLPPASHAV